jgi:hypothetical protein
MKASNLLVILPFTQAATLLPTSAQAAACGWSSATAESTASALNFSTVDLSQQLLPGA